jgi:hypothetical protein
MLNLPVLRLTLFSSGVGFFDHRGPVSGSAELLLPFHVNEINDALKSLIINDPCTSPAVSYPSNETLSRTLKSLSFDLNGSSIFSLLNSLKGSQIEVFTPDLIKGRILFVENRTTELTNNTKTVKNFLSISAENGINTICIDEISRFTFSEPKINADLNRALDLLTQSRNNETRNLTVKLSGETERNVSLSYVIPTALWKVSYRLDISQEKTLLQGWAIVDNDSDTDWENIELSLVTGKPVSFIQELYEVHKLSRPTIPLSIEGIATARTYDSGAAMPKMISAGAAPSAMQSRMRANGLKIGRLAMADEASEDNDYAEFAESAMAGGIVETASSRPAGDQFEFTIKKPVSLARRQSAMLPLVEADMSSQKVLVFSKTEIAHNSIANPAISIELTNNTGIKLPAGPITVYDGGTYAGDALIKFFPEGEKRLISYGEDLAVTGSYTENSTEIISLITILNGFMTLNKKQTYETIYTFRNAGQEQKKLIIEHPISSRASLVHPEYSEKTHNIYRFTVTLPSTSDFFTFTVKEEETRQRRLELFDFSYNDFARYISDKNVPQEAVRKAMQKASDLNKKILEEETALKDLQDKRERLIGDQERTRKNLEAAGNQTQQGKDYLQRLTKEDAAIDAFEDKINSAQNAVTAAKTAYKDYLAGIKIEK